MSTFRLSFLGISGAVHFEDIDAPAATSVQDACVFALRLLTEHFLAIVTRGVGTLAPVFVDTAARMIEVGSPYRQFVTT
jgi:hypothetical protein